MRLRDLVDHRLSPIGVGVLTASPFPAPLLLLWVARISRALLWRRFPHILLLQTRLLGRPAIVEGVGMLQLMVLRVRRELLMGGSSAPSSVERHEEERRARC